MRTPEGSGPERAGIARPAAATVDNGRIIGYRCRTSSGTLSDMTASDEAGGPGKTRTWWHPLLVRLLKYALSPAFEVRDEVSVGTLPLRADIVLLRREPAEISELARTHLSTMVERLNQWTLIEFKSPMDSLNRAISTGSWAWLICFAHSRRS